MKEQEAAGARQTAPIQHADSEPYDLQADMKVDRQLERLEDLESLADIIHYHRVKGARSYKIAAAIIQFVKEGK